MNPEEMFGLATMAVLPGWAILILAPRRWPALNAVPALAIPALLSALYAGLILTHFSTAAEAGGGFGTLAEVQALFTSDWALLAGWVHYLAFDLFVGAWAATRLDSAGVDRFAQAFLLLAIFMFGPLGLLLVVLIALARMPLRLVPALRLREV